jgi:aminopeptidase N
VSAAYDAAAQSLKLSLEQMIPPTPGQQTKQPMHIPLAMGLLLEDGSEANVVSVAGGEFAGGVLHLTQRTQTFTFEGVASRPVLSLNRSFSSPVNLHLDQSADDIIHIARYDSDLFSRWQAINHLAMQDLLAGVKAIEAGNQAEASAALISVLTATASDTALEPAFRAQALALPTEADIAREIGSNIDTDVVHAARDSVMGSVAKAMAEPLAALIEAMRTDDAFSPDAASAGKRALRNSALTWLSYADETPARTAAQFAAADNMTELAHALLVLAHRFPDSNEASGAISAFEARFRGNPLVIDKWFTIQATVPGAATIDRVKMLMASPHFAPNNPNRLRSLIGSFAMSNPTGFNRADGGGYQFLAQQIIDVDKRNPQVAARILTSMRSWRSLEPVRAGHAKQALLSIDRSGPLSPDVRDLVDRMLKP